MSSERASITLRALEGRPLLDPVVRDIVVATANAIAERNGVTLTALRADDDRITVELAGTRLMALGFAAELRRLTNNWYAKKFNEPTLWGEPRPEGGDELPTDWEI